MPLRSKPFMSVRKNQFRKFWKAGMDSQYETAKPVTTMNYVRSTRVASSSGKLLPFENRSSISVYAGKKIKVVNVGRKSAALYVPARDADTE